MEILSSAFGVFAVLFLIAFTVEALAQVVKDLFAFVIPDEVEENAIRLIVAGISVAYSFNLGVDFFVLFGYNGIWPWVGILSTGLLCSRGANIVHDLVFNKWLKKEV